MSKAASREVTKFSGFGPGAIEFFEGLEADNSKAYFEAHREIWEAQVKAPLLLLLSELGAQLGGRPKLFRQNRDVRFAKDKSPYKITTYGVLFDRPGTAAGLYAEVSSHGLYAGGGYYDMAPDQLPRFRAAVAAAPAGAELAKVVAGLGRKHLTVAGAALAGMPRGYSKDHPRAVLLKHTTLVAGALLPGDDPKFTGRAAMKFVAQTWERLEPLSRWLDRHVGASTIPPEVRWGGGR